MTTYGIGRAPCDCPYCKTARELYQKMIDRKKITERRERDDEAQT